MSQEYVFESPDGGHTVYRRHVGKQDRELVSVSREKQSTIDAIKEDKLWGNIRRASKTDPALKEMLDQVQVYYELKHDAES
jgi:predicted dithiol-disulfide oxidoreductase (DUF899 family)